MGQIAETIKRVLEGEEGKEALGPCWAHDLAMPVYERACVILDMPRDQRRGEIENNCPLVKKLLAEEVKRLYLLRKSSK